MVLTDLLFFNKTMNLTVLGMVKCQDTSKKRCLGKVIGKKIKIKYHYI